MPDDPNRPGRRTPPGADGLPDPGAPLPPDLDPRGRRVARAEARERQDPGAPGRAAGGVLPPRRTAHRRRGDVLGGALLGVRVVAALVSLAILVGAGYAWASYRQFNSTVQRVNAINKSVAPKKDVDGKDQNILLVGIDDRDSISAKERKEIGVPSDGGSNNTDTMMILHVPADGKQASVISFPRDSWVTIAEGFGKAKLNSAYADGVQKYGKSKGWQVLVETLQNLTGLTIDHFLAVNLLGFYNISNAVGGVQVCLTRSYTAAETNASLPLPKGHFTISGKTAIAFVRQRDNLPRGDLDRIVRQQYFMSAMFRKIASAGTLLNPLKTQKLIKAVASSLQLDDTLDVLKLGQQMSDLTAGNLRFTQIPTTGGMVGNTSVQNITTDVPAFARKYFGLENTSALSKAKVVAPSTVSVDVRNASGRGHWAATNAAVLKNVGFATSTGDHDPTTTTQIQYRSGMESQAKTLAQYVPGATLVLSTSVTKLTLILGSDGKQAKSTPSKSTSSGGSSAGNTKDNRTAAQAGCIN
ncbi:MAG: LCP family protein [Jatrophihabitans sp.]